MVCDTVDCIQIARDRDVSQAPVNTEMKIRNKKKKQEFVDNMSDHLLLT
jgi:hypothetical protein